MSTLKKLDIFWHKSNCNNKWKLIVYDAVIRAKFLYGLESAQLTDQQINKLDVFQLKVLRKLLKFDTTYINRENKNELIYSKIQEQLDQLGRQENKEGSNKREDCYPLLPHTLGR